VLLDCRHLDAVGQPRAMLDWRLTDEDMISSSRSLSLIGRETEAAGFGHFHVSMHPTLLPRHTRSGYDHMGTMRMHTGPAQGAVDADCRGVA
jgi:choline dehydrogenase-like flavoprotein